MGKSHLSGVSIEFRPSMCSLGRVGLRGENSARVCSDEAKGDTCHSPVERRVQSTTIVSHCLQGQVGRDMADITEYAYNSADLHALCPTARFHMMILPQPDTRLLGLSLIHGFGRERLLHLNHLVISCLRLLIRLDFSRTRLSSRTPKCLWVSSCSRWVSSFSVEIDS